MVNYKNILIGVNKMSKWKCGICGNEFENFHAQGFNGIIYCPLCYFKEDNRRMKKSINKAIKTLGQYKHYYLPEVEQNSKNEDVVMKALSILKGD